MRPPLPSGVLALLIGSAGIDGSEAAQLDRPVIVIELVREEERAGEAVVLRAVVAVVLMSADGVTAKAVVLRDVGRQAVVSGGTGSVRCICQ